MTKLWFLPMAALMVSMACAETDNTRFISSVLSPEELDIVACNAGATAYIPSDIRECLSEIDSAPFCGGPLGTLITQARRNSSIAPIVTTKTAIADAIKYYEARPESEPLSYVKALSEYQEELEAGKATFSYGSPEKREGEEKGRIQSKSVSAPDALKKDVAVGSALFIKGKGALCGDLKVGKNLAIGGSLSFNHRGCTKLRAKGGLEKNLLNLRGVFAFDCAPCVSLFLDNQCSFVDPDIGPTPRVGCIDEYLNAQIGNPAVKGRCGFGISPECATIKATGSAASGYILGLEGAVGQEVFGASLDSLITDVVLEVAIPLSFCVPFCDCPVLAASLEERSVCPRSICVESNETTGTFFSDDDTLVTADSVQTVVFQGYEVSFQHSSRTNVWLKVTLFYTHSALNVIDIGLGAPADGNVDRSTLCGLQQTAIQTMGNDANQRLQSLWFHVIAEGRVL